MDKKQIINQFTKALIVEENRKNKVTQIGITSTLITAAIDLAFVNESCKSSGKVSKSQVIYRKVSGKSCDDVKAPFQEVNIKFLKMLKILSRNRKFIVSFDTTKEAFYGGLINAKDEDRIYLHPGSIARESYYYYEYLTCAITGNLSSKYILDAIITPRGYYVEDYVKRMIEFVKKYLLLDVVLFDRGFDSWGLIYELKKLNVKFMIFWKKQGEWYKSYFKEMKEGEFILISRTEKYNRDKSNYKVDCQFVLIKQLEYEDKKFDWIFATNLNLKKAEGYVKRYKKRWGIETIYRVTDDIRIFTTSTNATIRCFLFVFTCLVYNVWRFFQIFLGKGFTLANFKTCMIIYMAEKGVIDPKHYVEFKKLAKQVF
ncbi:MAG: transposase [Nanoarchaeota archaeon]|nr:transposase [Nanoarchaeota archaeon]